MKLQRALVWVLRRTTFLLEVMPHIHLWTMVHTTMISLQIETLLLHKVFLALHLNLWEVSAAATPRGQAQLSGLPQAICGWGMWHLWMRGRSWLVKATPLGIRGLCLRLHGVVVTGLGDLGYWMRGTECSLVMLASTTGFHQRYLLFHRQFCHYCGWNW